MATYTTNKTGVLGLPAMSPVARVISGVVDFTVIAAGSFLSADVARVLFLPANSILLAAGVETITAGTGTGTVTLKDTLASPNTYTPATAVGAIGQHTRSTMPTNDLTMVDTAAQRYLTLTGATATRTNGKVRVWAIIVDLALKDVTAATYA